MHKLRLKQKRQVINLIRDHFNGLRYFELETPLLVASPGMEVHLHSFQTEYITHAGTSHKYHLPTSPEFALKKALGSGFEKVFEIARVFRNNGELGSQHQPEFNMLEWYRPGHYLNIMDDVETLLDFLSKHFDSIPTTDGDYWNKTIKRTSIQDCFKIHAGMDLELGMRDIEGWRNQARKVMNEQIPTDEKFEDIFFRVWLKLIEPKLGQNRPEIVYDYPPSMAALAKLKEPNLRWAERFELYIKGVEIGNAFSELIDPEEQLQRCEQSNRERAQLGFPPHPIDMDMIAALGKMKPTGGIAIGVERLLMVLTGSNNIREFFLYPIGEANLRKN